MKKWPMTATGLTAALTAVVAVPAMLQLQIPTPVWSNEFQQTKVEIERHHRERIMHDVKLYKNDLNLVDYKLLLVEIERAKLGNEDSLTRLEYHLNRERQGILDTIDKLNAQL